MEGNAIVLFSGGMDSSTALYWAVKSKSLTPVVVHFSYKQRGAMWEFAASKHVVEYLDKEIPIHHITLPMGQGGALIRPNADLAPGQLDKHGHPVTFVPGRNLIHIAMSLPFIYHHEADYLVGGWTQIDVDYPDCRKEFLDAAAFTGSLALARSFKILYPLMDLSKAATVALGSKLGVPWHLTRSCYADGPMPCGECDSCLLRVAAFDKNEMVDPIYTLDGWNVARGRAVQLGYL